MSKWGLVVAAVAALVLPAAGVSAGHASRASLSALDKHYLKTSVAGDAFEIKGGKMAPSKGSDPSVKLLGQTLVKDHTKSLGETQKTARKLGVKTDPSPEPPMQWELAQVSSQSGKSFDQSYAKLEVDDHIQDIKDTVEEITSGTNAVVRS